MILAKELLKICEGNGISLFTGVPDSTLAGFTDVLAVEHGEDGYHVVVHNEGAAVALAGGHFLAVRKPALVYMQNSGLGNAVNPITSLTSPEVYDIPVIYLIGWRGEPGGRDEPQHVHQGRITPQLTDLLGIDTLIVDENTTLEECRQIISGAVGQCRSAALLVKRGALVSGLSRAPADLDGMSREEAAGIILDACGQDDTIVSTTGKLSREIFERRTNRGESHQQDFLTVGSMGHAAMIALGIARQVKERRVWCLDGDGAVIMHMGVFATLGAYGTDNLVHVIMNNQAYESVGSVATAADRVDFCRTAEACSYRRVFRVDSPDGLRQAMADIQKQQGLTLLEVCVNTVSRKTLGRPTASTYENKAAFMDFLQNLGDAKDFSSR